MSHRLAKIRSSRWLAAAVVALGVAGPALADEEVYFRAPSGNIHCAIWTGDYAGVRCDIAEFTPSYRKRPADCDLDWGGAFSVDAQGAGYLACVGDTIRMNRAAVLDYGKSLRLGAFVCRSETAGMTCTNGEGHGFSLSRAKQKLF